jgi:hypothetical protein
MPHKKSMCAWLALEFSADGEAVLLSFATNIRLAVCIH